MFCKNIIDKRNSQQSRNHSVLVTHCCWGAARDLEGGRKVESKGNVSNVGFIIIIIMNSLDIHRLQLYCHL